MNITQHQHTAKRRRATDDGASSNLKLAPKKLIIPKKTSNPRKVKNNNGSSSSSRSLPLLPALPRTGGAGRRDDDSLASSLFSVNSLAATEDFNASSSANNLFSSSSNTLLEETETTEFDDYADAAAAPVAPVEMVHLQQRQQQQQQRQSSSQGGGYDTALLNALRDTVSMHVGCDSDSDASSSSSTGGGYHHHRRGANDSGGSTGKTTADTVVDGVRYHDVKPSDTVERLCMKYRVSAPALRRANIGLTGRNLQTGPKRLIIPPNAAAMMQHQQQQQTDANATQDTETATTHDDDTNTLALSDGHSTLADQIAALEILDEGEEDGGSGTGGTTLYHDVLPSDTLQGVCLAYGISAYELRRANNFRGLTLEAAPERLAIPRNNGRNGGASSTREFRTMMTREEKIRALMAHVPTRRQANKPLLSHDEARAYLEFNDWNFDQALRNVKVDVEWSSQRSKIPTKSNNRSY
mmetsp:Transcript_4442/g.8560  ORF Transcript_4442/g.8560 Transcript_4442/m.8560 type:complete len:468 (+) Transcript_4442:2-1405(+)